MIEPKKRRHFKLKEERLRCRGSSSALGNELKRAGFDLRELAKPQFRVSDAAGCLVFLWQQIGAMARHSTPVHIRG